MVKVIYNKKKKCYLCGVKKKILYSYQDRLYCKHCFTLLKGKVKK